MKKIVLIAVAGLFVAACQPLTPKSEDTKSNARPNETINTEINAINRGVPDRMPDIPR